MLTQDRANQILVVGKNSFIAKSLFEAHPNVSWRSVGHADDLLLDGIDTVINFALHPDLRRGDYEPEKDIDLRIAQVLQSTGIRQVLISSRKVYDINHQWMVREDGAQVPQGAYGVNKAQTERAVSEINGENLTILRVANVVGYEVPRTRGSFMAMMLGGLKEENTITLDVNPSVRRDFMGSHAVGLALGRFLTNPESGVFNFGSGEPVSMGDIANALIEGYGSGSINVINDRVFDEFVLDTRRWDEKYGKIDTTESLLNFCRELGKKHAVQ